MVQAHYLSPITGGEKVPFHSSIDFEHWFTAEELYDI